MQQCFSLYMEHTKYNAGAASSDQTSLNSENDAYLGVLIIQSFAYILIVAVIDHYQHRLKYWFHWTVGLFSKFYRRKQATSSVNTADASYDAEMESPLTPTYGSMLQMIESRGLAFAKKSKGDLLSTEHITVRSNGTEVLDNFCIRIDAGEKVAVIGPNGCGKSTLFSILALEDSRHCVGEIHIKRLEALSHRWEILRAKSIGYVPQNGGLIEFMTVGELHQFFAKLKGCESYGSSVLNPKYSNYLVRNLSGGNKKKIAVELAYQGQSPLILLDEVTSGIDPISADAIVQYAGSVSPTSGVLFSSHRMNECLSLCSRALVIREGKVIFDGSCSHFDKLFREYFQVDVHLSADLSDSHVIDALNNTCSTRSPLVRSTSYGSQMLRIVLARRRLRFSTLWSTLQGNLIFLLHQYLIATDLKARGNIVSYKFREIEVGDILHDSM